MEPQGSVTRLEKVPRGRCRKWKLRYRKDGKERTRRFEGTYSQAKEALALFRAELELPTAANETFAEYASEWRRRRAASGEYERATLEGDAFAVNHLCPYFGPYRMADIRRSTVIDGLESVRTRGGRGGAPLSGATMVKLHFALKSIMREAVYDGALQSNPVDLVKPPKNDTRPKKALSLEDCLDVAARLRSLPVSAHLVGTALMLFEGLRRGEVVGLEWRHVENGGIRVEQQGASGGGVKKTKTRSGVRTVPVMPIVGEMLDEWKAAQKVLLESRGLEQDGRTPVMTTAAGTRMCSSALYAWWQRNSLRLLGVECTPHELRHTFLTMLANSGAPLQTVRSIAGWADISMANVYVHADASADAEAVGLLDARMCRALGGDVPMAHPNLPATSRSVPPNGLAER